MQYSVYILMKDNIIDENPYAMLFHRVKCSWFKNQILASAFI